MAGRGVRVVFLVEVVDRGLRLRLMVVVVVVEAVVEAVVVEDGSSLVKAGEAGRAACCASVRPPSCEAPPIRMWPAVMTFRPITGMVSSWLVCVGGVPSVVGVPRFMLVISNSNWQVSFVTN